MKFCRRQNVTAPFWCRRDYVCAKRKFASIDPGDKYDSVKWDFNERNGYRVIYIEGYPYKVLNKGSKKAQEQVAMKLKTLRDFINQLCYELNRRRHHYPEYIQDNIDLFLDIHEESEFLTNHRYFKKRIPYGKTSFFLLSQIPPRKGFDGMNKPKERYISNEPYIGPDKNIRANYRDIFLDVNKLHSDLLIHELAHTFCNHVQWRPDDHGHDFITAENILKDMCKFVTMTAPNGRSSVQRAFDA